MPSISKIVGRSASFLAVSASLGLALAATSCGGGGSGSFAAKPMVLVEFLFVDRSLTPAFPTGVKALPRNAEIIFQFSEQVDPSSINDQTIAIRFGSAFQSIPKGAFQVAGNQVIFDPTLTEQGTPNPFGFDPVTQYNVELPKFGQANDVVRNRDNDPLLNSIFTSFTTSDKFLRELDPPSILEARFIPGQDPLTKQVPGNAILSLTFDEPMDPSSFNLAVGTAPTLTDSVDVRYNDLPDPNINQANALENSPVPGSFTWDAAAKTYFFVPVFSFGDKKFVFSVSVFQGLKDLAGNLLVNPRSFGPFTCDGTGKVTGKILTESFDNLIDDDTTKTTGDWGANVQGQLQSAPITSRRAYITCFQIARAQNGGQYNPIVDPLIGVALNQFVTGITPATNLGRRVMWACDDTEVGPNGSVTAVSWGPDSNATFAAQYPDVILRLGYQKNQSISLASTFSGNYQGSPLVMYKGPYQVSQKQNVGNEIVPTPVNNTPYGQLSPLFDFTGYVNWPAPLSYFDWDEGDPSVASDSVLLFDASVAEGDTFQQIRGWFGVTAPNSGILIAGFPTRRMYSIYEGNDPDPQTNFAAGIVNPEPSWTDTAFTITKRVSLAQSRFYTPTSSDPAGNVYPPPYASQTTFGVKSNYKDAIITPAVQAGGAQILVEYQGAFALDVTSNRTIINIARPSTNFSTAINDIDGYPYIRWRITLTSNLILNTIAKVNSISIPIEKIP